MTDVRQVRSGVCHHIAASGLKKKNQFLLSSKVHHAPRLLHKYVPRKKIFSATTLWPCIVSWFSSGMFCCLSLTSVHFGTFNWKLHSRLLKNLSHAVSCSRCSTMERKGASSSIAVWPTLGNVPTSRCPPVRRGCGGVWVRWNQGCKKEKN